MNEKGGEKSDLPQSSRSVDVGGHIGNISFLENGAPSYELRIDRDGKWFHEGVEIVRQDISSLFSQHLVRLDDGSYCVRIGGDECPVVVEDVPFLVVRVTDDRRDSDVSEQAGVGLSLLLNDGGIERLDAETLELREANVPYCRVRDNLEARFSRAAYYQLAEFIVYDEAGNRYYLVIGDNKADIDVKSKEENY